MGTLKSRAAGTNLGIIFFLWPAATLFASIRYYRETWAKNALWLFIIFFGFTFIPREGNDSTRYILWLQDLHRLSGDYSSFSDMLYDQGSGMVDILQPLVTFIVALFTDDHRILFAVYGTIFGYFYSRNIWFLLEKTKGSLNNYNKVLIVIFALIVPIWYINGVRFWTAAHIFLFGALRFLMDNKTRGLWISFISFFMHFSFIFPVLIIIVYRVIGNRITIFFIFFIISNFISDINIPFIREALLNYTPMVFHDRIIDYTSIDAIESRLSGNLAVNWYVIWYRTALRIFIGLLLLIAFFKGKEVWSKRNNMLRLFSFLLLFGGFANILGLVPSVSRFILIYNLLAVSFLFMYFYYNKLEVLSKRFFIYLAPALALFLVVALRTGFDNTGVYAFITNPFMAPFITGEIALIDLIK
jgi:hypothetical protein